MLHGRTAEQAVIDRLLSEARAGRSGALLVRGEPGIGKTALLDYAAAGDMRVIRGTGVESEAELPFAGLHLLLRPVLDRVSALPEQQERALRAAFGLASAQAGDRLLVGLAVLSLLSELAEDGPLLVLVDDAQWLDRASTDALLFAARRLDAEGVALILAAREPFTAQGVAELPVKGLDATAASALLGPGVDPVVRYRVLAEARGNPLALIELPTAAPGDGTALPLTSRVQEAFLGQVRRLPEATQGLLAVASAEDTGDLGVVLRAAAGFGDFLEDLHPAESADLVRVDAGTVTFRHPLVRAAVYQGIPPSLRLAVHRALADALEGQDEADRRAWHLAMAATGPDEEVAAELERTAARASDRSGYAAAATAYERAARLSARPESQARRLTLAAETAAWAGELDRAGALAEQGARRLAALAGKTGGQLAGKAGEQLVEKAGGQLAGRAGGQADDGGELTGDGDERAALGARLTHVRATADFLQGAPHAACEALLDGAETASAPRAARMLLQALHSAWYLGAPELERAVARLGALSLPAEDPLTPVVAFVTTTLSRNQRNQGTPPPARTSSSNAQTPPSLTEVIAEARRAGADSPRDLVQACGVGLAAGQDEEVHETARSLLAEARTLGSVGVLPTLLFFLAETELFGGRHRDALATATEGLRIARDTGQLQWAGQMSAFLAYLAAVEGDEERCRELVDEALAEGFAGSGWTTWALGVLDLGHGRIEAALSRLEPMAGGYQISETRCVPDLVEAAVRLGSPERAAEAFAHYRKWADGTRRPWAAALVLRCRALLEESEEHFVEALRLDGRPFERARTELLYGEWLRRTRRKADARAHLRAALETFERLEAAPWAGRARAELNATGSAAPVTAAPGALALLTPQELQIVRLAAQGLSNRDIAAQLFLSPRTVGHHLYKAYPKLGVASRGELGSIALSD
ncbi:helix-turn-helix transcriptional regulator [Streptosporangium carneum]|uniref:Transcriptional regulator n=1 Tax=Streptosporangium carneum TaxID=47481 RepID=A0A9W6HUX4_9ACTN|nr:helix-turn-helix transcriptional regulator [Streptosporangium carneum]GLK06795.1 transcriptional regulator [Streptosporangium carneum]